MSDVFTTEKRSEIMSRIRSKGNIATEEKLVSLFKEHRIKGWRRNYKLYGKPDFVFPKERLAVFIDGEFWHGHPTLFRMPKTNREYWGKKIKRNKERDKLVNKTLEHKNWKVVRVWQHELYNNNWLIKIEKYINSEKEN